MSERPLTRREMRERERMEATGQIPRIADAPGNGAPVVAVAAPPVEPELARAEPVAVEPERTSVIAAAAQSSAGGSPEAPLGEPATQAPARLSRRTLHRPQLGDERPVARRPVAEPTTSTTIPKYGSVPVPIDVPAVAPVEEIASAEPETQVSTEVGTQVAPEVRTAVGTEVGTAVGTEEESSIEPLTEISLEPQAESAISAAEDLAAALEPEAAADAELQAVTPGWLPMAEVPAVASVATTTAAANEDEVSPEEHHTDKGLIIRYVMLVVAFFVIGALLWIFIDGQIGFGASALPVGITESVALGEFGTQ